jgi:hypothetical protein
MQEWEVQHRPQVRGGKLWHCVCGHGHPRGDDQPEGVPCKVQLCENVKKSAAPIQGRAMHTVVCRCMYFSVHSLAMYFATLVKVSIQCWYQSVEWKRPLNDFERAGCAVSKYEGLT